MTDQTDHSDPPTTGIDRRSALKKVAIGGAVAWTAPTVMSNRVSAQEACTLKCGPVGGVVISATVVISKCLDGPPGQQPVNGVITSITAQAGSCGCGGTPTVELLDPVPGGTIQIRPKPGSVSANFTVDVAITCLDRRGRPVTVLCSVTFTDVGNSGNCNSRGGDTEKYSAAAVCGAPVCATA